MKKALKVTVVVFGILFIVGVIAMFLSPDTSTSEKTKEASSIADSKDENSGEDSGDTGDMDCINLNKDSSLDDRIAQSENIGCVYCMSPHEEFANFVRDSNNINRTCTCFGEMTYISDNMEGGKNISLNTKAGAVRLEGASDCSAMIGDVVFFTGTFTGINDGHIVIKNPKVSLEKDPSYIYWYDVDSGQYEQ